MDSHLGLSQETGAGVILAEHSRVPRVVATLAPDSDSYRLLGQMSVPDTAAIRAERDVRWSEMIGSSTDIFKRAGWAGLDDLGKFASFVHNPCNK
ncbi:hypothetical protein TIFTF001_018235 [Ficus carica]|uniref:Uncharacterized protein n=1 Tax=Ficus carica TaxID=3494 RepID=A0AA88A6N8_FICCA|nr:hypothetical protein TIFTF001_018235 [Ficus carica]